MSPKEKNSGKGEVIHSCVSINCSVMSDSLQPHGLYCQAPLSMGFSSKNTGVGCHFLLQGIFPTQESNPGLPYYRQIPYHLSHLLETSHVKKECYFRERKS